MKKKMYLFGYVGVLVASISLQSCNDDPITPNDGSGGCGNDTTWVEDSTDNNGGGDPTDTTGNGGGNPTDTICWGDGNNGGGDPSGDSTDWDPNDYDSTYIGG